MTRRCLSLALVLALAVGATLGVVGCSSKSGDHEPTFCAVAAAAFDSLTTTMSDPAKTSTQRKSAIDTYRLLFRAVKPDQIPSAIGSDVRTMNEFVGQVERNSRPLGAVPANVSAATKQIASWYRTHCTQYSS